MSSTNNRLQVSFESRDLAVLDSLAEAIGCSRSAVAAEVLRAGVSYLATLPKGIVFAGVAEAKERCSGDLYNLINGITGRAALRQRGPSRHYISEAVGLLVSEAYQRGRHGSR